MLFSVCIPVYNTSKYLDECLQSVLQQTETDYEIVLVDDGSTDDSGQICDRYATQYPHIRVIHKENEGLMMTRRRGFQEARGDYFLCLDSDDYWRSDHVLARIKAIILRKNCDLVVFDYILGKEDSDHNKHIVLFDRPDGYVFQGEEKQAIYHKFLIGGYFNNIWIKVVSRKIMDTYVDYSPWKSYICRGEDMFQTYPMLTGATRIGYIKEPFVQYRWTPGSISNKPKLQFYGAFRTIYSREEEYLPLWDVDAETVKKARLRRIPNILGIVSTGYHACKKTGQLDTWKRFIKELSDDPFFHNLFPTEYKKDISAYYRLLGRLIIGNHSSLLSTTLSTYQWYLDHIKQK